MAKMNLMRLQQFAPQWTNLIGKVTWAAHAQLLDKMVSGNTPTTQYIPPKDEGSRYARLSPSGSVHSSDHTMKVGLFFASDKDDTGNGWDKEARDMFRRKGSPNLGFSTLLDHSFLNAESAELARLRKIGEQNMRADPERLSDEDRLFLDSIISEMEMRRIRRPGTDFNVLYRRRLRLQFELLFRTMHRLLDLAAEDTPNLASMSDYLHTIGSIMGESDDEVLDPDIVGNVNVMQFPKRLTYSLAKLVREITITADRLQDDFDFCYSAIARRFDLGDEEFANERNHLRILERELSLSPRTRESIRRALVLF